MDVHLIFEEAFRPILYTTPNIKRLNSNRPDSVWSTCNFYRGCLEVDGVQNKPKGYSTSFGYIIPSPTPWFGGRTLRISWKYLAAVLLTKKTLGNCFT